MKFTLLKKILLIWLIIITIAVITFSLYLDTYDISMTDRTCQISRAEDDHGKYYLCFYHDTSVAGDYYEMKIECDRPVYNIARSIIEDNPDAYFVIAYKYCKQFPDYGVLQDIKYDAPFTNADPATIPASGYNNPITITTAPFTQAMAKLALRLSGGVAYIT